MFINQKKTGILQTMPVFLFIVRKLFVADFRITF